MILYRFAVLYIATVYKCAAMETVLDPLTDCCMAFVL